MKLVTKSLWNSPGFTQLQIDSTKEIADKFEARKKQNEDDLRHMLQESYNQYLHVTRVSSLYKSKQVKIFTSMVVELI